MERYICSENRNQISMLPMCLDDMLQEDAEVRAIDAIVEKMDIASMDLHIQSRKRLVESHIVQLICLNCMHTATSTEFVLPGKLNENVIGTSRPFG